jgi:N-methylhydantoinase B
MIRHGRSKLLPSKLTLTLRRGDVFRHEIAGGGGWGDPLERDPEAVLRDVRNGLVSPQAAADEYGVVVDTAAQAVDEAATVQARRRIRAARSPDALQDVMWHQPDHGATTE